MPMNEDLLAQEMLAALGGKVNKQRLKAFKKLASAIVKHIQTNMVVTSLGVAPPGGGPVTSTSTLVT